MGHRKGHKSKHHHYWFYEIDNEKSRKGNNIGSFLILQKTKFIYIKDAYHCKRQTNLKKVGLKDERSGEGIKSSEKES